MKADLPCLRCHSVGGIGTVAKWMDHPKMKSKVSTTYGATVFLETPVVMRGKIQEGGRPLFPLFDEKGKSDLSGRMGCMTCHDPHAGSASAGEGNRRGNGGFLRDPSGVFLSEICAPCHRGDADEHIRKFHALPRKTD